MIVLITATPASEPLVRGEWLNAGQHIIAIGADDPTKCDLDATALKRARVFVDSLPSAAATGDLHRAIQAGKYNLEDVSGEIGEVLSGQRVGPSSAEDVTIEFVGIGAQDLAVAEKALQLAS